MDARDSFRGMGEVGERKISRTAPGVTVFSQSFSSGYTPFVVIDILAVDRIILESLLGCGLWVWKLLLSNLWYTNDFQLKLLITSSCTNCY